MFLILLRKALHTYPFDLYAAEALSSNIHRWEVANPTKELSSTEEYLWQKLTAKIIEERNKRREQQTGSSK